MLHIYKYEKALRLQRSLKEARAQEILCPWYVSQLGEINSNDLLSCYVAKARRHLGDFCFYGSGKVGYSFLQQADN